MKTFISLIFLFLFFTKAYTQSFYPIERNKSRFEAKMRSNRVKQKSKYAYNSNSQKFLEEQIIYNEIGMTLLIKNNKESYTSITEFKYDKFGMLSGEKTKALGSSFLKALSIRFPNNNGFLVPPNSNGGELSITYKYNKKYQLINKEIIVSYFGKSASEITGTEKYHLINEYDNEGNFIVAFYLKNDKKVKFKERLIKKDTVQYNFLDSEGKLVGEEIYDVPNKVYLHRKYLSPNNLNEPSSIYKKYFKKDYRLFKEEKYIKDANDESYINRNTFLIYDSQLDLSDIVEMDANKQVIERIRNNYNAKGLLIEEVVFSPDDVVKERIEYVYEYYK